jgi:hypothetical protein
MAKGKYFSSPTVSKMKMKVEEENWTRRVARNEMSSKSDYAHVGAYWYRGCSIVIEKVVSSFVRQMVGLFNAFG